MKSTELQGNLYWLMLQVVFRAKHQMMKLADNHGLSVMQMYTLCSVEPGQPVSMNYLAGLLACDASNVTGIIDRLFAQDYIMREESPKDRRVKMITITPAGERLREQILAELPTYDPGMLERLDESQKLLLQQCLTAILAPSDVTSIK